MTCNYFEYIGITEKMFYGVSLTDEHLNNATEQLIQYLINGGAENVVNDLGIGIKIVKRTNELFPDLSEVVRRRFVWIGGERKGQELTIDEIQGIGMFLNHGALYGRI